MKKIAFTLALALAACFAIARPESKYCDIATGSGTAGTNTITRVSGYLDEVRVLVTDGASTGTVAVAVQPADSSVSAVSIATNAVAGDDVWYPVRDYTDTAGAALTSDQPARYLLDASTIIFSVSGSPTNKTWRLRVRCDDGR